jgi:uncharacterized membrane protein
MPGSHEMEIWLNRQTWRLAKHWLLVVNILSGAFVGLAYLAPLLMHYGYTTPAKMIYYAYRVTCHQLPSRSFFIFGYQGAFCHRDTAIWAAFFTGGVAYHFVRYRLKPLPFHWWILALIPNGLDGGTQLVGPLYEVLPDWSLTGFALIVWLILTGMMALRRVTHWQYYLFVLCFPLAMMYVQFTGPRLSTWQLRTLTGSIMGLANVWLMFPLLEESFRDLQIQFGQKLRKVT